MGDLCFFMSFKLWVPYYSPGADTCDVDMGYVSDFLDSVSYGWLVILLVV